MFSTFPLTRYILEELNAVSSDCCIRLLFFESLGSVMSSRKRVLAGKYPLSLFGRTENKARRIRAKCSSFKENAAPLHCVLD